MKNAALIKQVTELAEKDRIDTHNGNVLRAVSWWSPAKAFEDIVTQTQTRYSSKDKTTISKVYMELANEFRIKNGVEPVEEHWVLTAAAYDHSVDMVARKYLNHFTPEGLSPSDRVKLVANNNELTRASENIAAGYPDIFNAHHGWINSYGHRQNLLNNHRFIGFGFEEGQNNAVHYTTKFSR